MPRSRPGIFLKGPPSSPAVGSPGRFSIRARRISASPVPIPSESSFWVFPDRIPRHCPDRRSGRDPSPHVVPGKISSCSSGRDSRRLRCCLRQVPSGRRGRACRELPLVPPTRRVGGMPRAHTRADGDDCPAALLSHDRENGLQCDKRAVYRERDLWYARSLLAVNPPHSRS
jgi:hypothetical protein